MVNLVTVKASMASAMEIRGGIERTLVRNTEVDVGRIKVTTDGGHVTLPDE